jgi:hypothetical protein
MPGSWPCMAMAAACLPVWWVVSRAPEPFGRRTSGSSHSSHDRADDVPDCAATEVDPELPKGMITMRGLTPATPRLPGLAAAMRVDP